VFEKLAAVAAERGVARETPQRPGSMNADTAGTRAVVAVLCLSCIMPFEVAMNVVLSPQTQKLLEERMKCGDYKSPDKAIRAALEVLEGETLEKLGPEVQAAIARADAQAERGEGLPVDEAFARLRQKHFGN
jgi:Arc/MetJ-type ribon-helix-helix transcriptional regulator